MNATPQDRHRHKSIVLEFLKRTHVGDLAVIDVAIHPDIVTHGFPGGHDPRSREEYKEFFRRFSAAFADMRFTVLGVLAEDDKVAVRFAVRAMHHGDFAGHAATGRQVDFNGMALYRLSDGMIAETWLFPDVAGILRQIA